MTVVLTTTTVFRKITVVLTRDYYRFPIKTVVALTRDYYRFLKNDKITVVVEPLYESIGLSSARMLVRVSSGVMLAPLLPTSTSST